MSWADEFRKNSGSGQMPIRPNKSPRRRVRRGGNRELLPDRAPCFSKAPSSRCTNDLASPKDYFPRRTPNCYLAAAGNHRSKDCRPIESRFVDPAASKTCAGPGRVRFLRANATGVGDLFGRIGICRIPSFRNSSRPTHQLRVLAIVSGFFFASMIDRPAL